MSADRWSYCPRCQAAAKSKLASLYGQVDEQKYLAERERIAKDASKATLREDFEFFLDEKQGTVNVVVSYGANCTVCGLSLSFRDSHLLYDGAE